MKDKSSELDHSESTDLPEPEAAPLLTGKRRVLVDALTRKSGNCDRAIGMYLEALRAMERNDGPESLHVAAYELREFMYALPRAFDLPVVAHVQIVERVQSLVENWRRRSNRSKCLKDGKWDGPIDGELGALLERITSFVLWFEEWVPSRRTEAESVLKRLAPTENPFPSVLMKLRTSEWSELLRYFNSCTQDRKSVV